MGACNFGHPANPPARSARRLALPRGPAERRTGDVLCAGGLLMTTDPVATLRRRLAALKELQRRQTTSIADPEMKREETADG